MDSLWVDKPDETVGRDGARDSLFEAVCALILENECCDFVLAEGVLPRKIYLIATGACENTMPREKRVIAP